ncbi:MAG: PKD domain-containing protein [Bacteroidota bacterium]
MKNLVLKSLVLFGFILLGKNTHACNIAPVFTYNTSHTCGIPTIVKVKNTSTGTYSKKATYWWKVNNFTIDSTKGLDSTVLYLKNVGSNSIKLFVKDSTGCIDSSSAATVTVTTNAKQIVDQIGNPSYNPYWIHCIQYITDPDTFSIRFTSNDTLKQLKIFWGDGNSDLTGADVAPNTVKSHLYSSLGVYTVKIVTVNGSCVDTVYGTVYNQRQPTAGIIGPPSGSNRGCVPFVLRIVNNSYNISDNTTFSIDWGNGDKDNFAAGAYADTIYHRYTKGVCGAIIELKAQNACGSSITSWNPVDVSDKDKAKWDVSGSCDPTKDWVFQNLSSDRYCLLPDPKEYFWDFGDGTTVGWITSKADQRHKYAVEGDYIITLIAKNGCGKDTYQSKIRVYHTPKAGFVYNLNRGCKPLVLNVTDTSKGRGYTRTWTVTDKNGSQTFTDSILSYTFYNSGVYSIKLSITNPCGTSSTTQTIYVNDKPTAKFATINGSCVPLNVAYTNTSTSFFTNPSYSWDFGDGTTSTLKSPASKIYTTAGNYTVTLVVKDSCGTDTFKQTFTAYGLPKSIISGDTVGCTFDSLKFINNSTNANQFDWTYGDYTSGTTSATGLHKHMYSLAGSFQVRLIAGTGSGCKDTSFHNVRIKPGAKALFSINQPYACAPATFKVVNNSIYGKDFRWYANGKLISTNLNPADSILNTDSTIVRLKLIATSASSCQGDSIEKIYFTPKNPKAIIGNKDSGCGLLKVVFNNASTNAYTNNWTLGNGQTSTTTNPTAYYASAKKRDSIYNVKLNVANWLGCKDSTTAIVKVFPGPTADYISNVTAGCGPLAVSFTSKSTTNNTNNFSTLQHRWTFNNGSTATTANAASSFSASKTKDTFYQVVLKVTTINGCNDSIVKKIQVYPNPLAKFKADKVEGCQLLKVNFTNQSLPNDTGKIAIMSFKWNSGNGVNGIAQNFNANYKASAYRDTVYKVKLVAYSEHVCADSTTLDITVHPDPKAQFNLNRLNGCTPLVISTDNLSRSFDGGSLNHQWKFGNGVTAFTKNDTLTYYNYSNKDSAFKIVYEVTSIHGCKDTAMQTVTVRPKPVANFTTSTKKGCAPLMVDLKDASVNPYTHFWGVGTQMGQAGANKSIVLPGLKLFDTLYMISHAVTSVHGCLSDTVYQQILVLGRPEADFNLMKDSMCAKENVNFANNSLGGYKYNWKFGDNTTSTMINPRHKYYISPSNYRDTIYKVSLEVISSTGCKDTAYQNVFLVNKPKEPLKINTTFGCTDLVVKVSNGSKTYATNFWDFGDNTARMSEDTVSHIYINESNMTFNPKITLRRQRYNCYDTAYASVLVYPKPTAELKATRNDPCDKGVYQFINKTKSYSQNEWNFNDGTTYMSSSFSKVLPSSLEKDTFYSVQLIVSNVYNCKDTIEQVLKVKPKLNIKFSKTPLESCEKGVVTFKNESANALRFFWKFGDGGLSNEINPSYVYNKHGLYKIILYGYDKDGCVDSTDGSDVFKVIERPVADFDFLTKKPKLPNATVSFVGKPTIISNNVSNLRYEWDFGDGTAKSAINFTKDPQHTYTAAGNVEVRFTVYNQQCSDYIVKPLFIEYPKPEVQFAIDKVEGCAPLTVKFTNNTIHASSYRWIFGDGSPDAFEKNPTHVFEFEGKWDVTLIATGNGGTTTVTMYEYITVNPRPHADFNTNVRFMNLPKANFSMTNLTNNAIIHRWFVSDSLGDIIATSNQRNPNFTLVTSGRFGVKLIETNEFGCSDTLFKPNYLGTYLPGYCYVPNAFTPNNNGRNDGFKPSLQNVKPTNFTFAIYNRWGEVVYQTTDINGEWDGTFNGQICEQENYIWKITGEYENNDEFAFRGTVTLLR